MINPTRYPGRWRRPRVRHLRAGPRVVAYRGAGGRCGAGRSAVRTTRPCAEVRFAGGAVGVRDSKDRSGPTLTFDAGAWAGFLRAADRPGLSRRSRRFSRSAPLLPIRAASPDPRRFSRSAPLLP
ncbi:DUF397 domain-containing protein, partial [Micromonospora qiuiae]|uniref:DUF397 domain-containing protein n=1 Tax=Micromonospora qiuiae TaxID=502268 RepID=UPI00194E6850